MDTKNLPTKNNLIKIKKSIQQSKERPNVARTKANDFAKGT